MWHKDDEGNIWILMIAEDGLLGIASVQGSSYAGWVQRKVIELDKIPIEIGAPSPELSGVGLAEGSDTIFISTNAADSLSR
jgi:hypothetical protein